jgi:hypothetical protein
MSRRLHRQPNLGIYDPPEPSPNVLPEQARREWGDTYRAAMDRYGDNETAEATAWRKIRLSWRPGAKRHWQRCHGGQCFTWPYPGILPMPAMDLVNLGVLVEYAWINKEGELEVRSFAGDEPTLWWDDDRKAMYSFPQAPYPGCSVLTAAEKKKRAKAVAVYERWHARSPECAEDVGAWISDWVGKNLRNKKMQAMGPSDVVVYRSDKWHDQNPDPRVEGAQEYIHKHWSKQSPWTWQDLDRTRSRPNAIFIQGGALQLHERGLIH